MANDDNDDSWKTAAAPMAASILTRDISCQGILALTLRDALSQIQQEQQQQQQQSSTGSSTGSNININKCEDDDDLLTGTNGTTTDGTPCNKNTTDAIVMMDNVAIQNILQAMGNAVAQTQQEHWRLQQQQQQQQQHQQKLHRQQQQPEATIDPIPPGKISPVPPPSVQPPAALVRGRLDHYNRHNGKWRIVMDKVTFRRRMNLEPRRVRRKSERRPSLWQVSREQFHPPPTPSPNTINAATAAASAGADTTTTAKQEDIDKLKMTLSPMAQPSGITLQILAYNDLE